MGKTDRFRAAVSSKPVINWYSFVLTADMTSFFYRYWFPGLPWDHEAHYMKRSPLSLAGHVTTPTMVLTGEEDYRTPISRVGAVLPGAEAAPRADGPGARARGLARHRRAAERDDREGGPRARLVRALRRRDGPARVGRPVSDAAAAARRKVFRELHASGCFVIPNPWDLGSARLLAGLGFRALATTSSGLAWSLGARDNHVPLERVLAHLRAVVAGVELPVSADFEAGFAVEPAGVAANVAAAAATGIAGLSIEDGTGDPSDPLFDFSLAVERVRAARRAVDEHAPGLVLTARSEGFIVGRPDLGETIRRLTAFAEAGADCLYAPGIRTREQIAAVVGALAPRPVNVLVGSDFTTVAQLSALGVRRISTGGALARAAWTSFLDAAREIADSGAFARARRRTAVRRGRRVLPNGVTQVQSCRSRARA